MRNATTQNGVSIARTPTGVGVALHFDSHIQRTIVIQLWYMGRKLKQEIISSMQPLWRDYLAGIDNTKVNIVVLEGTTELASLRNATDEPEILPFMVRQGEQHHITENYVSVPPALTITDEVGAVWTLGFITAPKDLSPDGEFAFDVLRDGIPVGIIASRIERRNSKIRAFTRKGWKSCESLQSAALT